MPAKICPRCGNLYEDIKSKTCPNCFSVLDPIDRETAQAMARARAAAEQSPEFQAIKAAEDERWREQSFRACLGVVGIFLATAIFAAVLITVARRHNHHAPSPVAVTSLSIRQGLAAGPAANAAIEDVMPARVGDYDRTTRDQDVTLPGGTTPIFHASYSARRNALQTADVFAVPADRPPAEQDAFVSAIGLSARLQKQASPPLPFDTAHWRYLLLGPSAPDVWAALAAQFRGG